MESEDVIQELHGQKKLNTMVILPNKDAAEDGFLFGVAPLEPTVFRLRCSKNNKVDVFDNQ